LRRRRVLELRDLHVAYGRIEVVHGVDLKVVQGEVVGMVGPNGAGKSSMLRAICGLNPPSAGEVSFEGGSLRGRAPEQIARSGLAMVPEGRQIFKTLSVQENLRLGARAGSETAGELVLERFPILKERASQRADRLSGGEQQQLALARALVADPKLLILDEPSFGLAPKMIDVVYELLAGLRAEGMTMLLVEQNATRTIEFCDRCAVLSGGKIRAEGSREELQRNPQLLWAYLGRQL
jgi:branched-chain amino acid transport system ATP-binding protein